MALGDAFSSVLAGAQAGAPWAWERLYAELSPPLLGYLRARGTPEPEDALGEVWVQLARHMGSFVGDEPGFRSWAFSIAHHRAVDGHRRRARDRASFDLAALATVVAPDDPEERVLAALAVAEAAALLGALTAEQREVLLLRLFGDLSVAEVAVLTGRPAGAVKSLQHRALAALRRRLDESSPEPYLGSTRER